MSNETQPEPHRVAPVDWRLLRKIAFAKIKLPGWFLIFLAFFNYIPDIKSRLDFWSDMARSTGGHMSDVAKYTSSAYFPALLAILGFLYLVFVGEAKHTQKHRFWSYFGWVIFASCATAIISVSVYGAFEAAVRRAIAERQSTISHDGTNPKSKPEGPDPSFDYNQSISRTQFRILVLQSAKFQPFNDQLYLARQTSDFETFSVWQSFTQAFNRGGIRAPFLELNPDGSSETGIMIVVKDPSIFLRELKSSEIFLRLLA